MKILIIEDEPKAGKYLRRGLNEAGFVADVVGDGLDGFGFISNLLCCYINFRGVL